MSLSIFRVSRHNISDSAVACTTCARLFPCGWTALTTIDADTIEIATTHKVPATGMCHASALNTGRTISPRELIRI